MLYRFLIRFIYSNTGAFSVFFALSVPIIFGFIAFTLNNTQTLNSRIRLSQAADEAALTISYLDNRNTSSIDLQTNIELAENYFLYYIGNYGSVTDVNVVYEPNRKAYYITSNLIVSHIISTKSLNFDQKVMSTGNDREASGIAIGKDRYIQSTDITFVLDFSDGMSCKLDNPACTTYLSTGYPISASIFAQSRAGKMLEIVKTIINKHINESEVNFAIVPFDYGTPFKPKNAVHPISNFSSRYAQYNEAGGERIGCSMPYTFISPYEDIDYAFWADKSIDLGYYTKATQNLPSSAYLYDHYDNRFNFSLTKMDYFRYYYYHRIVGPALGLITIQQQINAGLCVNNGYTDIWNHKYRYSCGITEPDYIANNIEKVLDQNRKVVDLLTLNYHKYDHYFYPITTLSAIDVDGTIANIFSNNNIKEFYQPVSPNTMLHRPFATMCQSALSDVPDRLYYAEHDWGGYGPGHMEINTRFYIDRVKSGPSTYLIPLTTRNSEKSTLITEINNMTLGGGSDIMGGLLRAAPIAASGDGEKKVIIIISDGIDVVNRDSESISSAFNKKGVCQVIRNHLDSITLSQYGKLTTNSEIHFISTDSDRGLGTWYTHCVDGDSSKIHDATNDSDMKDFVDNLVKEMVIDYGSSVLSIRK